MKQFTFYKLYSDILDGMNDTDAGKFAMRICEYEFEDKLPEEDLNGKERFYWNNIADMPLTREEERHLLEELQRTGSIYAQALVFLLYTGLRVGELASVTMEGDWVRAVSLKGRKGLKDKIRRIPISPNLKRFLPLIRTDEIVKLSSDAIARHVKDYFEGHRTHDLRHTFITRAQEVAIRREIVSLWVGHAPDSSITSLIYTHLEFNEQLQLDEIKKFDYVP